MRWWVAVRLGGRAIFLTRMRLRRACAKLRLVLIRRRSWHRILDLDVLASDDGVELVEVKSWIMALKEGLALGQLSLDPVDMAARGEGLPVTVLLVALYARRCACCTLWVLGVALRGRRRRRRSGKCRIIVGRNRRHLP